MRRRAGDTRRITVIAAEAAVAPRSAMGVNGLLQDRLCFVLDGLRDLPLQLLLEIWDQVEQDDY